MVSIHHISRRLVCCFSKFFFNFNDLFSIWLTWDPVGLKFQHASHPTVSFFSTNLFIKKHPVTVLTKVTFLLIFKFYFLEIEMFVKWDTIGVFFLNVPCANFHERYLIGVFKFQFLKGLKLVNVPYGKITE